jgi:hypothetical protein
MADEDIEILDEMASYRRSMAGTGRVIAGARSRADSRARAAGEEADRGGQAGEVRARGSDPDRYQRP